MNVHMRIITDKNVDQLLSLKGGNDIATLTGLDSYDDIVAVIEKVRKEKVFEKNTVKDKLRKEFTPIEAAKVHLFNEGDSVMWINDNVANRKWIISSIDEESNNVTLTTNNLLGLSSNVMTLDASELKHGNPEEFAIDYVDNEGNWGMPNQGQMPGMTSAFSHIRLITLQILQNLAHVRLVIVQIIHHNHNHQITAQIIHHNHNHQITAQIIHHKDHKHLVIVQIIHQKIYHH